MAGINHRARQARRWSVSALYIAWIVGAVTVTAQSASGWQSIVVLVLGTLACVAVFCRVRYPYALLVVAWAMTLTVTQVLLVPALFSLGARRRNLVSLGAIAVTIVFFGVAYSRGERLVSIEGVDLSAAGGILAWVLNAVAVVAIPYLLGVALNVRRELLASYEQRALFAEQERASRDQEAVLLERQRIATETHDILGHKLALISMQAGGLELNADAGTPAVERQANRIGKSARAALADLRAIIGALDAPSAPTLAPQDFRAITNLVEESRASGAAIELDMTALDSAHDVPEDVGRAVYRIVQETLTNAHRHAPAAPVSIVVSGSAGVSLNLEVRNRVDTRGPVLLQPGGRGLPGLRERARIVGGSFSTHTVGSEFLVRAELPWPAPEHRGASPIPDGS